MDASDDEFSTSVSSLLKKKDEIEPKKEIKFCIVLDKENGLVTCVFLACFYVFSTYKLSDLFPFPISEGVFKYVIATVTFFVALNAVKYFLQTYKNEEKLSKTEKTS